MGCFTLVLGCLFPLITDGKIVGFESFTRIIAIINIPWFITGFTLIFPSPSLAVDELSRKSVKVAEAMNKVFVALIKSFCVSDFADLYLAEASSLCNEINSNLQEISKLLPFAEAETKILTGYQPRYKTLLNFCDLNNKLFVEFRGLISICTRLINDRNQAVYVTELTEPLLDINEKVEEMYIMMVSLIETEKALYYNCDLGDIEDKFSLELEKSNASLVVLTKNLMAAYREGRKHYIHNYEQLGSGSYKTADNAPRGAYIFHILRVIHLIGLSRTAMVSPYPTVDECADRGEKSKIVIMVDDSNKGNCDEIDPPEMKWFPPQYSFHITCLNFFVNQFITTPIEYASDSFTYLKSACFFVCFTGTYTIKDKESNSKPVFHPRDYIHPIKIASAITIASLLTIVDYARSRIDNSVWAATVIALIQQDNSSSSYLIGTQRMEGTVIGAVVSFTLFQILRCENLKEESDHTCGSAYTIPILVVWNGICALYREDPRHGYAAVVAAFTPNFLLLGPALEDLMGAWQRVEITFIGVVIYLIVDNLFWPVRSDYSLRYSIVTSIDLVHSCILNFRSSLHVFGFVDDDVYREKTGDYSENAFSYDDDVVEDGEEASLEVNSVTLIAEVMAQKGQLKLAEFEPELWHPPFPIRAYEVRATELFLCTANYALIRTCQMAQMQYYTINIYMFLLYLRFC